MPVGDASGPSFTCQGHRNESTVECKGDVSDMLMSQVARPWACHSVVDVMSVTCPGEVTDMQGTRLSDVHAMTVPCH